MKIKTFNSFIAEKRKKKTQKRERILFFIVLWIACVRQSVC